MTCICQNRSVAGRQPPGEDVGEGCSVPAAHQNGHSSILNILGNSWGLPIHILRVFWIFLLQWGRQFAPPSWLRLDRRHCTSGVSPVIFAIFAVQFFENGLNVPLIKEARVDTC